MRNSFEEALHFRHACKVFDAYKKIPEDDLKFILQSARMSPSSFGMEAWKFVVIQDSKLKKELSVTCWNPTKLLDCSDVVVLLNQKKMYSNNPLAIEQFKNRGSEYKQYLKIYSEYLDNWSEEKINCWSSKQVYIASGFLMMGAASIGVDSCPIEGFDKEKATKVLDIDTQKWEISYMVSLGYRAHQQQQRFRRDFDDVVEFR